MAPDREPDKTEDNPADGEKLWLNGMDELGRDTPWRIVISYSAWLLWGAVSELNILKATQEELLNKTSE